MLYVYTVDVQYDVTIVSDIIEMENTLVCCYVQCIYTVGSLYKDTSIKRTLLSVPNATLLTNPEWRTPYYNIFRTLLSDPIVSILDCTCAHIVFMYIVVHFTIYSILYVIHILYIVSVCIMVCRSMLMIILNG